MEEYLMDKPNIFKIATSELSQDALITWLLKWADKKNEKFDKYLHNCAVNFVRELIGETENYQVNSVEANRQWKCIDVCAKINNEYFIVIEDKKGTKEHSNQLKRYAEIAKEKYKNENIQIILIYFKMEEQGKYTAVKESGFSIFSRDKMLSILKNYFTDSKEAQKNDILLDYYNYLRDLNENINSYQVLPIDKWCWYSWKGFFANLQRKINGNWDYVPNASGGFLGFWWNWNNKSIDGKQFEFYLQLEYNKLIFKLHVHKPEYRKEIRSFYRNKLLTEAKKLDINIHRYGRIGKYMGVAKLDNDYRITDKNGLIDISSTIENLRKMEKLISLLSKEINN